MAFNFETGPQGQQAGADAVRAARAGHLLPPGPRAHLRLRLRLHDRQQLGQERGQHFLPVQLLQAPQVDKELVGGQAVPGRLLPLQDSRDRGVLHGLSPVTLPSHLYPSSVYIFIDLLMFGFLFCLFIVLGRFFYS